MPPPPKPQSGQDWFQNYEPKKQGKFNKKWLLLLAPVAILLGIIMLITGSGGSNITSELRTISINQKEITSAAGLALSTRNARAYTRDNAATVLAVSQTHDYELTQKTGTIEESVAALSFDPAITEILESAAQTNTFDDEFPQVMIDLLNKTNTNVETAYELTDDDETLALLTIIFDDNEALITGLK